MYAASRSTRTKGKCQGRGVVQGALGAIDGVKVSCTKPSVAPLVPGRLWGDVRGRWHFLSFLVLCSWGSDKETHNHKTKTCVRLPAVTARGYAFYVTFMTWFAKSQVTVLLAVPVKNRNWYTSSR